MPRMINTDKRKPAVARSLPRPCLTYVLWQCIPLLRAVMRLLAPAEIAVDNLLPGRVTRIVVVAL